MKLSELKLELKRSDYVKARFCAMALPSEAGKELWVRVLRWCEEGSCYYTTQGWIQICQQCEVLRVVRDGEAVFIDPSEETMKERISQLTTTQLHDLDQACVAIRLAFKHVPYLVGSSDGSGGTLAFRDVDVRLILPDEEFTAVCPTLKRWELLCKAIGVFLSAQTGLPVDFQIQARTVANAQHSKPRNPLGVDRTFAGGGDGTPAWNEQEERWESPGAIEAKPKRES